MNSQKGATALSKSDSWRMFDDISPRYDLLNHLLSFRLDIHWRRQLAKFLAGRDGQKVLDLATGTATSCRILIMESASGWISWYLEKVMFPQITPN